MPDHPFPAQDAPTSSPERTLLQRWKDWGQRLKVETYALSLAWRDPRTPWYARCFTALVVAYAFSPIDLIPDFIPVLGYLDDLLLVPLGVGLALRMIPPEVMDAARLRSAEYFQSARPTNQWGVVLVISIWLVALFLTGLLIYHFWYNR